MRSRECRQSLNARTGSMRVARQAGTKQATNAASIMIRKAAHNARGFLGSTLYNRPLINWAELKDRNERKSRTAPQHSETKAEVLHEVFYKADATCLPALFFDLRYAAQRAQRRVERLVWFHSICDVFVSLRLDMEVDFLA